MATALIQASLYTSGIHNQTGNLDIKSGGDVSISLPDASQALKTNVVAGETVISSGSLALDMRSFSTDATSDITQHTVPSSIKYGAGDASGSHSYVHGTELSAAVGTGAFDRSAGSFLITDPLSLQVTGGGSSFSTNSGLVHLRSGKHEMNVGGVTILTIDDSKATIHRDIDILGTLNRVDATINSMRIRDPNIRLAHDARLDTAVGDGATGVAIQTVPGAAVDATYMSGFKKANGTPLFVAGDNSIDVHTAEKSGAFDKHFSFSVGSGAKVLGKRTEVARSSEPSWDAAGGSIRLERTVATGDGIAIQFAIRMRVTDDGSFEVIREATTMTWNAITSQYTKTAPVFTVLQSAVVGA